MMAAINALLLGAGVSLTISGHRFNKWGMIVSGGLLLGFFAANVT